MPPLPSFERLGPPIPISPVVLSVPHAGRDYPEALRAAVRVPLAALKMLEDRYVDALALDARGEETMFVANRARAWIDLNRAENDRDPRLDDGAGAGGAPLSAKVRSGLGLVPRRAGAAGEIWRRRLSAADVASRIHDDHRPYHQAVAETLTAARDRFGIAVLLDLHSMPPLGPEGSAARLVIGDRFGKAAAGRFANRIDAVASAHGIATASNVPYAGGHLLERHGQPRNGIHALQLEFDRSLYLDAALDGPGPGLPTIAAMLRAIIDAVTDEAQPLPLAAE